jgi:acyl dehydratase
MSAVKELTAAPSLMPLYARAAITAPLHRGDTLPDTVYSLADQRIDTAHLVAYERVCGFRVTDELPPTYLHVLAFPLSVALMTESSFPFPLVGLVHVANSITMNRLVRADEVVSVTVRAANLRPHNAGRQLDILADALVDGEVVWSGRSTYLRRGGSSTGGGKAAGAKAAGAKAEPARRKPSAESGAEQVGAVAQVRVPESIGRKYAAVSGDRNPIHLHALAARAFGFPKAIAHGMWLKARTLAALEGRLPQALTVEVAFKTPVFLPSTVAIATALEGSQWALDVRNARSGKPHLTGSVRRIDAA